MKKIILLFFLILMPALLYGQYNINGRFSASAYAFQRAIGEDNAITYLKNYEMLTLNASAGKFSLRTRMSFEHELRDELRTDPRFRVYNMYLEAREILDIFRIRVGRQSLFNSVVGGLYCGVNLMAKTEYFTATGYYGGGVPEYQEVGFIDDWANNYLLGGKLETFAVPDFRFAVSYVNKNYKPQDYTTLRLDANNDPIQVLIEANSNQYEYVSGEASFRKDGVVFISTRYDYDMNFSTTSKFEAYARYEDIDNLGISAYYNYREPKVGYNSIFSVFNYGNTQEIEGGLDYMFPHNLKAFVKVANVQFEDENSQRISVGVNTGYGTISYRKNLGYAGELDGFSIYTAKSFMKGKITPSVGLSYTNYKLSEDAESNSIVSVLGGINYRIQPAMSFDLQGQYFKNEILDNDFRVLVKFNHWFNLNFN